MFLPLAIPGVPAYFSTWLVSLAISFAVRQAERFGEQTDWEKVKADLSARVAKLVPGEFLDEAAVALLVRCIEKIEGALSSPAKLKLLLEHTSKGEWLAAFEVLKDLVIDASGIPVIAHAGMDADDLAEAREDAFLKALAK